MSRSAETNRLVLGLAASYAAGLAALMIAIAVADSKLGAGIALAWTLAVLLYARHALRCPLCGASVLNAAVGPGLSWLTGSNRRCPQCRTNFQEAATARSVGPGGGGTGTRRGPKEERQ